MPNNREPEKKANHNPIRILIFIIICVATNILLSKITMLLQLPFSLDALGTILAAVIGGYLPGILVAFLTHLIIGLSDFSSIYYGTLNILIAIASTYLCNKGLLKRFWKTLIFILILSVISGGLGGLIPILFSNFNIDKYFTDFIYDLSDKTVSVLTIILIITLIPEQVRLSLHLRRWKQAPLEPDELEEIKKVQCRYVTLHSKIIFLLAVILSVLSLGATLISFFIYRDTLIEKYTGINADVGKQAASIIDPSRVEDFIEKGETAKGYIATEDALQLIYGTVSDVEYIHVYQISEDGCHVVFDLDTEKATGNNPGDMIPFDRSIESILTDLLAGKDVKPIISKDSNCTIMTSYTPVFDDNKECVCHVVTVSDMSILEKNKTDFFSKMIFLFLGFIILIIATVVWFADYNIVYPLNSITHAANEAMRDKTNLSAKDFEKLQNLDIHSGDEVESLYQSLIKMLEYTNIKQDK